MEGCEKVQKVEVITVIKTASTCGSGLTQKDPVREVVQYWDFEGNLLAESGEYYMSNCVQREDV